MKRTIKSPDVRKLEIIAVSKELFRTHGYEQTSVEAIIQAAGIAKGTFYYYFKAKKDILIALVELIATDITVYFQSILDLSGLSAIDKLTMMLGGSEKQVKIQPDVMEILHHPENRSLQEKLNIKTIEVIAPLIAKVVEAGNQEGVFHVDTPLETVQFLLAGSAFILESGLFNWSYEKNIELKKSLQTLIERGLGAKPEALM
jgi:AcrR family transcriptional regulator